MSLDVYLTIEGEMVENNGSGIFIRENGSIKEISREEWNEKFPGREPVVAKNDEFTNEVFTANITHNLNTMADKAGIYTYLWHPDKLGIDRADSLIKPLSIGLRKLVNNPEKYKKFNPENGWGDYEGLVEFVSGYLIACIKYPQARVGVCG